MKVIALGIRFILELAALAALAAWGIATVDGFLGWLVGLGAATMAAIAWGLFVAPRARIILPTPARLAIEVGVFAAATAGLVTAGRPGLGAALGGVYILDRLALVATGAPAYEPPPPRP